MGVIKRYNSKNKKGYVYEVNFTYRIDGILYRHYKYGFNTKKEAEEYMIRKKNEIYKNGSLMEECKLTLNEVFDEFITEGSKHYQENTIYNSKKDQHYFADSLGKMMITKISHNNIQDFFNKRQNEGIETNKNIRKTLNRVFLHAIRRGYIKANPLEYIIVKGKDNVRTKDILKESDFDRLLQELNKSKSFRHHSYCIALQIGWYTGLRISEVIALYKHDFDFDNDTIIVDKKLVYKGKRTIDYKSTNEMKSKKSKAIIPLPRKLKKIILEWFKINPYDKVIVDEDGKYVNPASLSNYIKKISNKIGIEFNFHMLRHSYATRLVENDVDVKVAQELMRHDNFNTTFSIYSHINSSEKKRVVDQIFK